MAHNDACARNEAPIYRERRIEGFGFRIFASMRMAMKRNQP